MDGRMISAGAAALLAVAGIVRTVSPPVAGATTWGATTWGAESKPELAQDMGTSAKPGEPATADRVLTLWPDGPPDEPGGMTRPDVTSEMGKDDVLRIRFVDSPTMSIYRAPVDRANGAAVVVLPGGGYQILAWNHEGTEVAEWLISIGVTAVVVKYRVPRRDARKPHPWPLQDARRAMRLTRHHASEWGIDPDRIGLLGFSAGGHLALATATLGEAERVYAVIDEADDASPRPDFLVPIYAAYLDDPEGELRFPEEIRLSKSTPPTFLSVTYDDQRRGADAARLFIELKSLGVPAELHVFSRGGHGYGMRDRGLPVHGWPQLCADWMRVEGWLGAPAQQAEGRARDRAGDR